MTAYDTLLVRARILDDACCEALELERVPDGRRDLLKAIRVYAADYCRAGYWDYRREVDIRNEMQALTTFIHADKRVGPPGAGKEPTPDRGYPGGGPTSEIPGNGPETTVVPEL